jgi:hypothetical protein
MNKLCKKLLDTINIERILNKQKPEVKEETDEERIETENQFLSLLNLIPF